MRAALVPVLRSFQVFFLFQIYDLQMGKKGGIIYLEVMYETFYLKTLEE